MDVFNDNFKLSKPWYRTKEPETRAAAHTQHYSGEVYNDLWFTR